MFSIFFPKARKRTRCEFNIFPTGMLEDEIYVEPLDGFITSGQDQKVYSSESSQKLKQALGAPWYNKTDEHLFDLGSVKSLSESIHYVKKSSINSVILSFYVRVTTTGSEGVQI